MGYILYWTIVLGLAVGLLVVVSRLVRGIFRHLFGPAVPAPSDRWWNDAMDPTHPDHQQLMTIVSPRSINVVLLKDDE